MERQKNEDTIVKLELKKKDIRDTLDNLTLEDYSEGPKQEDFHGGQEMWIFGKNLKNTIIYIKVTIAGINKPAVCISFHEAEYNMIFPFLNTQT